MVKAKEKTWLVTLKPPKGGTPKLTLRPGDTGSKRTAVRYYTLAAADRAEAQSLVEQQERMIAEQEDAKSWLVDKVEAA